MAEMPGVLTFDVNYGFMNRPILDMLDTDPDFDSFPLRVVGMPYYLQAMFTQTHNGYPSVLLATTKELELLTAEMDRLFLPYQTKIIPEKTTRKLKKPAAYRVVYLGATVT
jgi:hypothetical protein